jgi:hypothetical protein
LLEDYIINKERHCAEGNKNREQGLEDLEAISDDEDNIFPVKPQLVPKGGPWGRQGLYVSLVSLPRQQPRFPAVYEGINPFHEYQA